MSSTAIILKSCDTVPVFLNIFDVFSAAHKQQKFWSASLILFLWCRELSRCIYSSLISPEYFYFLIMSADHRVSLRICADELIRWNLSFLSQDLVATNRKRTSTSSWSWAPGNSSDNSSDQPWFYFKLLDSWPNLFPWAATAKRC